MPNSIPFRWNGKPVLTQNQIETLIRAYYASIGNTIEALSGAEDEQALIALRTILEEHIRGINEALREMRDGKEAV